VAPDLASQAVESARRTGKGGWSGNLWREIFVNRSTPPVFLVPTVFIPAQMRDLTRGVAQVVVAGDTVGAVVDELETQFPGIRQRLCRGDSLAPGLQVSVDSTVTPRGLRSRLQPGSEVHFLPAFGGG